jgi:hypothetical protein
MAVTLWNSSETPQRAEVLAPGYVLEKAEWQNAGLKGTSRVILPNDIALLIFRRG